MLSPIQLVVGGLLSLLSLPAVMADTPVYVMLPLDIIDPANPSVLSNPDQLKGWFNQLKGGDVQGVMADFWWGIVEAEGPQKYQWGGYMQLMQLVQDAGLKIQVILSYHQCGGNVGDACDIPLPSWVLDVGKSNPDIFYTDSNGHRDHEYLSLGVDEEYLFQNRCAVALYSDVMKSFKDTVMSKYSSIVDAIEISMGPAGELRYPGYQLDQWQFPGIGAFQSYDKYLNASVAKAACDIGHCEWGGSPNNAGSYNSKPEDTGFFQPTVNEDNWQSDYGKFFLGWYSDQLIAHGDRILGNASSIFGSEVQLAAKISGVHWYYKSQSHAAELTTGYYNVEGRDGYAGLAQMMARHGALFDFTCFEMRDNEQPSISGPEELVRQTQDAAKAAGIPYDAENALPRYDDTAYGKVEDNSRYFAHAFTYLRLGDDLMNGDNWNRFTNFVKTMRGI